MIFANLIQITNSTLRYMKFGKKFTKKRGSGVTQAIFAVRMLPIGSEGRGSSVRDAAYCAKGRSA